MSSINKRLYDVFVSYGGERNPTEAYDKAMEIVGKSAGLKREAVRSRIRRYKKRASAPAQTDHALKIESDSALIIGDTHLPFEISGYLEFCKKVRERFDLKTVIHIGDLFDNHAMSYHENDVNGMSSGDESVLAQEKAYRWYEAFPEVKGVWGNHDRLVMRKANTGSIPKKFLKSFESSWDMPKEWSWHMEIDFGGVRIIHGEGAGGKTPAMNHAEKSMKSTVCGHHHTAGSVNFIRGHESTIFGLSVGCGIDRYSYAMAYAKNSPRGLALGCGVLLDGGNLPIFVPMR